MKEKQLAKNTGSLFLFHIAKILFPFIVLPYLTRTMSTEAYGVVAYVKTVMTYMQVIVDFGFTLSATKDIVKAREDRTEMSFVIGDTLLAKLMLGAAGGAGLLILLGSLPLLRENPAYTLLSYGAVLESIFLLDFLFRGLEIMHVITIRFLVMKTISTGLTFCMVKSDADMLWIPVLDILGSLAAVCLVFYEIRKRGILIKCSGFSKAADRKSVV